MGLGNALVPLILGQRKEAGGGACIMQVSSLLTMNGALRILISLTCHSSPWLIHSFPFMRPLRQGSRLAQSRATVLRAGVNLMWLPHLIACEQRGLTMETLTHSAFCLSQDGQRSLGKRQGGDGDKDHINQHKGGRSVCAGAYSRW